MLLVEPLEAAIDLIEVAERFTMVPVDLPLHLLEASIHCIESPEHGDELLINADELLINADEPLINPDEPLINADEPLVDDHELLVDGVKSASQKLNEGLILARRHGGPLRRQTALDLVHSRLEVADAPAELGQVAIERIAPSALVGKDGLDAPE
jgi:hypothetical protein